MELVNKTRGIIFIFITLAILGANVGCGRSDAYLEPSTPVQIQASANFYTHDTDLDGLKEIISLGDKREAGAGSIHVHHVTNGQFSRTDSIIVNNGSVSELCFNDFNNDGRPDFIAKISSTTSPTTSCELADIEFETALFVNQGDGDFEQMWTYKHAKAFLVGAMACADFTGDGRADLIIGGVKYNVAQKQRITEVQLFTLDDKDKLVGKWRYEMDKNDPGDLLQLRHADINNDGKQDLVAPVNRIQTERGTLLAFLNDGTGVFEKAWQNKAEDITKYFYGFKVADMNSDGYDDIIARLNNNDIKQVAFFINNKDGTFIKTDFRTDKSPTETLYAFTIGDFDGDGAIDLALATEDDDSSNSWLSIYSNNNILFKKIWENHFLEAGEKQETIVGYSNVYEIFAFDLDNGGKSELGIVAEHFQYDFVTEKELERIELSIFR